MTNEEADQFLAVFLHGANNLMERLDQVNEQLNDLTRISNQLDTINEGIGK